LNGRPMAPKPLCEDMEEIIGASIDVEFAVYVPPQRVEGRRSRNVYGP
jgi:hypothetical protein